MGNRRSVAATLMSLALATACSHASSSVATSASPSSLASRAAVVSEPVGRAFGDSAAFGARIVKFEPMRNRATLQLDKPAYVVLLEVSPGKSIELIAPLPNNAPVMASRGSHQIATFIRIDTTSALSAFYQACYESGMRAMMSKPTPRPRPAVKDSTGKVITPAEPERINQPSGPSAQALSALDRRCKSHEQNEERAIAARRKDERYLLLLTTDSPISGLQILARINALTVTASDITSTMEAIAQGLFADRKQTWSGYYVSH